MAATPAVRAHQACQKLAHDRTYAADPPNNGNLDARSAGLVIVIVIVRSFYVAGALDPARVQVLAIQRWAIEMTGLSSFFKADRPDLLRSILL